MDTTPELFFPEFDSTAAMWPLAAMIFLMVGVLGGFFLIVAAFMPAISWVQRVLAAVGGLALMAGGIGIFAGSIIESDEREASNAEIRENRADFIEDRGVRIPDSRWEDLEFPVEKPEEDERYGIAQGEYQGKIVSVVLAWESGELKLYKTDGEELTVVSR